MKTPPTETASRKAVAPRHIKVNELLLAQQEAARQLNLDATLQNARREAMSLAWSTGYPFLVLPVLTDELESNAREYWTKQTYIQRRSSAILHRSFPVASRRLAA